PGKSNKETRLVRLRDDLSARRHGNQTNFPDTDSDPRSAGAFLDLLAGHGDRAEVAEEEDEHDDHDAEDPDQRAEQLGISADGEHDAAAAEDDQERDNARTEPDQKV